KLTAEARVPRLDEQVRDTPAEFEATARLPTPAAVPAIVNRRCEHAVHRANVADAQSSIVVFDNVLESVVRRTGDSVNLHALVVGLDFDETPLQVAVEVHQRRVIYEPLRIAMRCVAA